MAQLRDARTSEILHEGTPLEVALLAEKIGRDEVLFDDVGEGFDPDAVLEVHTSQVEGHERVARGRSKDISADARQASKAALDTLKGHEARVDEHQSKVEQRLQEARARLED